MNKRIIYLILMLFFGIIGALSQNYNGSKILVFRNTGEINVFNTSEISKIELSNFDRDSIEHNDFVSQIFYQNDSIFTSIPISEIDSVSFGTRNIIEPKYGVKKLSDEEASSIFIFDEESISYGNNLSLSNGDIVYYDQITDILPYGLCAKITGIHDSDDSKTASIEILEPNEVFGRYLITDEDNLPTRGIHKLDYNHELLKIDLPETEINGYKVKGSIATQAHLDLENAVCDFVNGYYHGIIKLSISPVIQFSVLSDDSGDLSNYFGMPLHFNIPFLGGALNAIISLQLFSDFKAEAGIEYTFSDQLFLETEWTRHNGENVFKPLTIANSNSGTSLEQKIEAHLKGELFFGGAIGVQVGILFNRVGVGTEIKVGPKFEADFGLGALQSLSKEYNQEIYGNAKIECSLGATMETYTYINHSIFGDGLRTKLPFESKIFIPIRTLDLFPDFTSRAVLGKQTTQFIKNSELREAVSVSTYTESKLPYPIVLDMELTEENSLTPLAEVKLNEIVETPEKMDDDFQNFNTEIIIPDNLSQDRKKHLEVRPILNYKGFNVKAKPCQVASDMVFSPLVASFNSNNAYFICGRTPVSQHTFDDITFIEGNHVGFTRIDEKFKKKRTFSVVDFIDLSDLINESGTLNETHHLLGSWYGIVLNEQISIQFIDENRGKLNDMNFTYQYNSPLNGGISIQLENGGTVTFSVFELNETHLVIVPSGSDKAFTLSRT